MRVAEWHPQSAPSRLMRDFMELPSPVGGVVAVKHWDWDGVAHTDVTFYTEDGVEVDWPAVLGRALEPFRARLERWMDDREEGLRVDLTLWRRGGNARLVYWLERPFERVAQEWVYREDLDPPSFPEVLSSMRRPLEERVAYAIGPLQDLLAPRGPQGLPGAVPRGAQPRRAPRPKRPEGVLAPGRRVGRYGPLVAHVVGFRGRGCPAPVATMEPEKRIGELHGLLAELLLEPEVVAFLPEDFHLLIVPLDEPEVASAVFAWSLRRGEDPETESWPTVYALFLEGKPFCLVVKGREGKVRLLVEGR